MAAAFIASLQTPLLPRFRHACPLRNSSNPSRKRLQCALKPATPQNLSFNLLPAAAYTAYMTHLFLLPPIPKAPLSIAISEALNLSLNFIYLLPLTFPHAAPVLHPLLEAIFHVVVAWALLLLGFVSDGVRDQPAFPPEPFLVGAAFLTNIFYIPYLIIRTPPKDALHNVLPSKHSRLLSFAESLALPSFCLALLAASLLWGAFARPEFGDLAARFASFRTVLHTDILAYSFVADIAVFSVFQAWLVRDDAKRRIWSHDTLQRRAVALSAFPFLGLAGYLLVRARHAPIRWARDTDAS